MTRLLARAPKRIGMTAFSGALAFLDHSFPEAVLPAFFAWQAALTVVWLVVVLWCWSEGERP